MANLLNVPHHRQEDDSLCGPACILSILDYWGIIKLPTQQEIAERCGHTYELGCDDAGMKRALEFFKMRVRILNFSNFESINFWLQHKIPVIVDWFSGEIPDGHSSIVVGLDEGCIYLVDPDCEDPVRAVLRIDFERVWFDFRSPTIRYWDDVIIRQIMVAQP